MNGFGVGASIKMQHAILKTKYFKYEHLWLLLMTCRSMIKETIKDPSKFYDNKVQKRAQWHTEIHFKFDVETKEQAE